MTGLLAGIGLGWFAKWVHGALTIRANQTKVNGKIIPVVTSTLTAGAAKAETALDAVAAQEAAKITPSE